MNKIVDIVIIGSGPAAQTAAIYCSRANLNTLLFEGDLSQVGGQLITTTDVENFPGFPNGINGYELTRLMKEQSLRFGTQIITDIVINIEKNDKYFNVYTKNLNSYLTKSIIIASGATAKKLEFQGSEQFFNYGISACAVCDGALPIFRKKVLAVIGGGDTAMEEALFLSKYASKVYIIHRRDKFRASKIMQDRVFKNDKIEILWNNVVIEAKGSNKLEKIVLENINTNERVEKEVKGLFFAIGHKPSSDFAKNLVNLDEDGYIITVPGTTKTNIEGIFACGDVQDKKYRQAITAAGSGCMAALDVCHYLEMFE
jgi:thioredoxin reductase (NADPH)